MSTEDLRVNLNPVEFRRRSNEFFPGLYLTTIGIIQNVAIAALAVKLFNLEKPPLSLSMLWMQSLGSFLAIILIVSEYSWWVLLVRPRYNLFDIAIPYFLGMAEFAAIAYVDSSDGKWFLVQSAVGVIGIIALLSNRSRSTSDIFIECEWLRPLVLRNLDIGAGLVAGMIAVVLAMWGYWKIIPEQAKVVAYFPLFALMILMFFVSGHFLRTVSRRFDQLYKEQNGH